MRATGHDPRPVGPDFSPPLRSATVQDRLRAPGQTALGLLRELEAWGSWVGDLEGCRELALALVSESCTAEGFEVATSGIARFGPDPHLEFLRALALDRGGNSWLASEHLAQLLKIDLEAKLLVEVLSLAGKAEKRKSSQSTSEQERREYAAAAAGWYERAFEMSGDPFPAINAAAMSLLAGEPEKARDRARAVVSSLAQVKHDSPDYWLLATLGEAHLILGRPEEAARWYQRAVERAEGRGGDIASMWFDLRLLMTETAVPPEIQGLFRLGSVVAFAGHMIDAPARAAARFPPDPSLIARVASAVDDAIVRLDARVGYSSVACGADLLFAKAMLARKRELHVVLPFSLDDYYRTSVDFGQRGGSAWRADCDFVLANAQVHHATKEAFLNDESLWEFANKITQGLTLTRAASMGAPARALVVLDSAPERRPGGTSSFLEGWSPRPAEVIDLGALRTASPAPDLPKGRGSEGTVPGPSRRQVKAMLFADVKNFSKLEESKADVFFSFFPHQVSALLAASTPPVFQNTWGDGLFLVFDEVVRCAEFALSLQERMAGFDFEQVGLPADTAVRIGVHAGPVFSAHDPIIGRLNFFGSNVNRAARVEPVTTPGCVFATEQFAGLLAIEGGDAFQCEYMGIKTLAKGFDRCAVYRLSRPPIALSLESR